MITLNNDFMQGNRINDVTKYNVTCMEKEDIDREFPEVLRPYQFTTSDKKDSIEYPYYKNAANATAMERDGYIHDGQMNWYFKFAEGISTTEPLDPLYKRIILGQNQKGQTLTAPSMFRKEFYNFIVYQVSNPGQSAMSHDFTDFDLFCFDSQGLKTPYFLLYNFVKRKIYIVFDPESESSKYSVNCVESGTTPIRYSGDTLNILFKPIQTIADSDYEENNNAVLQYPDPENVNEDGYFIFKRILLDVSETALQIKIAPADELYGQATFQAVPSIMIGEFVVEDPDIQVQQEIEYFKLKWKNPPQNRSETDNTANIKVKLVPQLQQYITSSQHQLVLVKQALNTTSKILDDNRVNLFRDDDQTKTEALTFYDSYGKIYDTRTGAKEVFALVYFGNILNCCKNGTQKEAERKLAYNILKENNLIEKDHEYFSTNGLSVQIYRDGRTVPKLKSFQDIADEIAADEIDLTNKAIVKITYFLDTIQHTDRKWDITPNKYGKDVPAIWDTWDYAWQDPLPYQAINDAEITLSTDDFFIDPDQDSLSLDSVILFRDKNEKSSLIGSGSEYPISDDFDVKHTFINDLTKDLPDDPYKLTDDAESIFSTTIPKIITNTDDKKDSALYDLYTSYNKSGQRNFMKAFINSIDFGNNSKKQESETLTSFYYYEEGLYLRYSGTTNEISIPLDDDDIQKAMVIVFDNKTIGDIQYVSSNISNPVSFIQGVDENDKTKKCPLPFIFSTTETGISGDILALSFLKKYDNPNTYGSIKIKLI